ncbi:hypothetical protein GGD63_002670 [Bradyrhizobium sp. cir1]|uniref:hypothetical protein n=1 Tax=Bradyrhizobium sp. cir1 TaxID=1445730 RepID=UPI001606EA60|nr:hypothetical protein [Bradyrhizobium sp. cir1]MBB4369877.1 hypothetical protein [Bradyrhizobium sp. cir1]
MNAPRLVPGKSNEQSKIMRRPFNLKLRQLKMPVKQTLFFVQSFERRLARRLPLVRDKAVTCLRVNIAG